MDRSPGMPLALFPVVVLALAFSLALARPAGAQSWTVEYDASLGSLPSAQGFAHVLADPAPDDSLSEANYAVAAGVLSQGNTGGPNADLANVQYYEITPPPYRFDADVLVVDLRLKIVSSTFANNSAGFGVAVRDDRHGRIALYVGEASMVILGAGITASLPVIFDTTLDFADLQLRIDEFGASLRVNGTEMTTLDREDFRVDSQARTVQFGDLSPSQSSSSQLESLRVSRYNAPAASVRSYETVTLYSATNSSSAKSLTVDCPPGTKVLGGGAETIGAEGDVGLTDSRPTGGPPTTSWTGGARELVDTGASWQLRVDAICGEVSGYENVSVALSPSTNAFQESALRCSNGKVVIGGGGGIAGVELRQTLIRSDVDVPFGVNAFEWDVHAHDYGAATSSGSWNVEAEAICGDAISLEPIEVESAQDPGSPKEIIVNCPSGKVPIGGGATILGYAGGEPALRMSRPKDGSLGEPPVGWIASAQVDTAPLWSLEVHVVCAPVADPTVSKAGLVGRWKGDHAGGDSWDVGHGTAENGVTYVPSFLGGQAFSLDASAEQWIQIPSYVPLGFGPTFYLYPEASFTVDAWFQTDTLQPAAATEIVNLYDAGGLNGGGANYSRWAVRLQPEGFASGFFADTVGASGTNPPHGMTDLADGQPHHIALMRDLVDRRTRLYVDGVFISENTVTSMSNDGALLPGSPFPDPVAIGIWRVGASTDLLRPFHGLIDDVKFYRRALDAEEIQEIAGCALPIAPRTLNLDAARFGSPADEEHGLCVFLEAGTYTLTLVSPQQDPLARFTGWSPAPTLPWGTVYSVQPELDAGFTTGLPVSVATAQQAFDDTLVKQTGMTLTVDQRVWFSLVEDEVLDNRGGVSIQLEYVPEPSQALLLAAGAGLLALLSRRRKRPGL